MRVGPALPASRPRAGSEALVGPSVGLAGPLRPLWTGQAYLGDACPAPHQLPPLSCPMSFSTGWGQQRPCASRAQCAVGFLETVCYFTSRRFCQVPSGLRSRRAGSAKDSERCCRPLRNIKQAWAGAGNTSQSLSCQPHRVGEWWCVCRWRGRGQGHWRFPNPNPDHVRAALGPQEWTEFCLPAWFQTPEFKKA